MNPFTWTILIALLYCLIAGALAFLLSGDLETPPQENP